jgi:hypothetical protein
VPVLRSPQSPHPTHAPPRLRASLRVTAPSSASMAWCVAYLVATSLAFTTSHRRDALSALTALRGGQLGRPPPPDGPVQPHQHRGPKPPFPGQPPIPSGSAPYRPQPPRSPQPHGQPQPPQHHAPSRAQPQPAGQPASAPQPTPLVGGGSATPCPQPGPGVDFDELEERCGVRLSWHVWPHSAGAAAELAAPLGALYTPMKPLKSLARLSQEPARCDACSAVINPFAQVDLHSRRWRCPLCGAW